MQPLRFEPVLKRIRWGGKRLGTVLGKRLGPGSDYAESWEIVDHGSDQSIVLDGPFAGWSLQQLIRDQNRALLGRHAGRQQFPLLVKFLDAQESLSVQVHPNDELARQFDPTENGKTEAWVIVDAAPDSRLYVGLHPGVSASDLRAAIASDSVESLMHQVPVQAGDCVFVPAGTVHAIGAGILLAEIQQSSDLTFRVYDWSRVGADGKPRELHIDEAMRCIDFARGPVDPVTPRKLVTQPACEELVRSDHFVMQRHTLDSPLEFEPDDCCHVLMVLSGSAVATCDDLQIPMPLGQSLMLPAERGPVTIVPERGIVLLDAFLP